MLSGGLLSIPEGILGLGEKPIGLLFVSRPVLPSVLLFPVHLPSVFFKSKEEEERSYF